MKTLVIMLQRFGNCSYLVHYLLPCINVYAMYTAVSKVGGQQWATDSKFCGLALETSKGSTPGSMGRWVLNENLHRVHTQQLMVL